MRLFAALEVPDEVRTSLDAAVASLRDEVAGLRWTPPAQWHLTVAFLGQVESGVDPVVAALASTVADAPAAIELELAHPGRFGKRVLWIGVRDEPEGAVADLGATAQRALAAADLPVDEKPVSPHLTLARSWGRRGTPVRPQHVEAVPEVRAAWSVGELVLFESVQQGRGEPNRYEPRARLPLGA